MRYIVPFILLFVVVSCKKAEDRSCMKVAGENGEKEVTLAEFDNLFLGPHLKFILVQDTENKMILRGGKNLLNFVSSEVVNGELRIENKNKCNFLRSFKKKIIEVELHLTDIVNIQFEGTRALTCQNQLVQNDLTLVIRDGAGNVNLNLQANSLNTIVTHGWGNFDLNGNVNFLGLTVGGNGFGNSSDLIVNDSMYVISSTPEDLTVNCNGALMRAEIGSSGNIYYHGTPSFLEINDYGDGAVIDNN